jgi:choline dehydrogenase
LLDDFPGMTCGGWQCGPERVGRVRARPADPFDDPIIQPNKLSDPIDRRVQVAGMELARKLMHTPEFAAFIERHEHPADEPHGDNERLHFLKQWGSTCRHLIGTAGIGPASDRTSVVDDTLWVCGLQGLRVVGASIMPNVPSANTFVLP